MESSTITDRGDERPPLPPWARPAREESWFALPFRWVWALRWYAFEVVALAYAIYTVACPLLMYLGVVFLYTYPSMLIEKLDRPENLIPFLFDRFTVEYVLGRSSKAMSFQFWWVVLAVGAIVGVGAVVSQIRHQPWPRRRFRIVASLLALVALALMAGAYGWLYYLASFPETQRTEIVKGFLTFWLVFGIADTTLMFLAIVWAKRGTFLQFLAGGSIAFILTFVTAFAQTLLGRRGASSVALFTVIVMCTMILGVVSLLVPAIGIPIYMVSTYFGLIGSVLFLPETSVRILTVAKFFGMALFAAALLNALVRRQKLNVTYADLGMVFYFGAILLSYFFAEDRQRTMEWGIRQFGIYVVVYFLIRITCTTKKVLRAVAWSMVLGAAMAAAVGLWVFVRVGSVAATGYLFRSRGVVWDPNTNAMIATMSVPLALALFEGDRSISRRVLLVAMAGLLCTVPFVSASRSGVLGLVCAVGLMLFARRGFDLRAIGGVVVVGVFVGLIMLALPSQYSERVLRINPRAVATGRESADISAWNRVEFARSALYMFAHHPAIGVGARNFGTSLFKPEYHAAWDIPMLNRFGQPWPTHNIYLENLAELGLIGFAAFLSILALAWHHLARARRAYALIGDYAMARLSDALRADLAVLLAMGLFISHHNQRVFWVILALGLSMWDAARRTTQERHASIGR
jgi:hypothetical protein